MSARDVTPPLNPYKTLARQTRAMLQVEALFPPAHKQACQWHLLVLFCGTQASVGKGDVNTCFLTLGKDGERFVNYPHVVLERLDSLARQSHHLYRVTDGRKSKSFYSLQEALQFAPRKGLSIQGAVEGDWTRTHAARPNSVGRVKWIPIKAE